MKARVKTGLEKAIKAYNEDLYSQEDLINYIATHIDWLSFKHTAGRSYKTVYFAGEEDPFFFVPNFIAEKIMGRALLLRKEIESAIFDDKYEKTVQNFTFDVSIYTPTKIKS